MIRIEELKIFVVLLCSDNVCLVILLIMVFLGHPPVLSLASVRFCKQIRSYLGIFRIYLVDMSTLDLG